MDHYNEIKNISICEFLPPHLVIYVDSPAEEVQKNLKASGKVCVCEDHVGPNNSYFDYKNDADKDHTK